MIRLSCIAVIGALMAGCYTYEPTMGATPAIGSEIALDVSDAGRVALGGTMGPEIGRIEGLLVEKTPSEYVVSVKMVRLLRGGEQTWTGEQVHLKTEFVTFVSERQFSAGRTAVFAAGAVGVAVAAILGARKLVGNGTGDSPVSPPDSAHTTRRPVRP
jgi:hypothetical protein